MSDLATDRNAPGGDATLRAWVEHWAFERPDHPALLSPAGTVTYAELHTQVQRLASGLRSAGIPRGSRIAAQLPNAQQFVIAYIATSYAGCVFQTIHMPYREAEIVPLLAHGKSAAFIGLAESKDFAPTAFVTSVRDSLPDLKQVIAVGGPVPQGAVSYDELAASEAHDDLPVPRPADPYVLLYTSGTTSAPKGVMVAYENFLPNAARSAPELGVDGTSIILSAAPFTHLYGTFSINLALSVGATMALLPVYTPPALAEALASYRPTHLFSAPAHMVAAEANGFLAPDLLNSLKLLQISGTACPPALARTVQERLPNGVVGQLWGMSELQAGAFSRLNDPEEARTEWAGRANPGTELRIMDGDAPCPPGDEGELQVRGPSLFSGYLDNAEASAAAFTADGFFRTGDLAVMNEAGFIRITGRSKDVINRGGVKFNPADVEELLDRHPAIAQCAIVPVPDDTLGERACCVAVLAKGAEPPTLDVLRAYLTEAGVAKTKWPERLEFVDEMPMTPTRKIKKAELARMISDRDPR
ncbi:class I adenylate-forming enzyme family protein [Amorphus coralli]|uniref:class I adenylate-forming enzyme family protein n=1 Tax=Amorphus coralli TaxID=340680 RepID=UPI00036F20ED|nr:class I adenylate-forming enzyme family protein [Amorphus coralli]